MSRSQPEISNPASHFFKWSGSKGELAWYNKDTKENVPVKLPFEFLVLDQLSTITGYSEQDGSGFWSNEVKATSAQPLTVKTKRGVVATGLYGEIKDTIKSKGAKFASSVYIAYREGKDWHIGNLQVSGAALSPWIDLAGAHKLDNGKVVLTGSTEGKKGATVYQIPTFEYTNATEAEDKAAIALDKDLQAYLLHYFATTQSNFEPEDDGVEIVSRIDDSETLATPQQLKDFEDRKQKAGIEKPDEAQDTYNRVAAVFDDNDEPFPDVPPEYM